MWNFWNWLWGTVELEEVPTKEKKGLKSSTLVYDNNTKEIRDATEAEKTKFEDFIFPRRDPHLNTTSADLAQPKKQYKKKRVDDADVFVDTAVVADLKAKGVDVDAAVKTTLKKTTAKKASRPKAKKKITKSEVYTLEDWNKGFLPGTKKGK